MARTRPHTEHTEDQSLQSPATEAQTSSSSLSVIGQVLHGALSATQQTSDWLVQLQHFFVDSSLSWSDTLASEMKELATAKDPWQLVATPSKATNQYLDIFAKEMTAAIQQLYDSQLMWLGQWDKTVETAEKVDTAATPEASAFAAWGKIQDEWLQAGRNWIDSMKSLDSLK